MIDVDEAQVEKDIIMENILAIKEVKKITKMINKKEKSKSIMRIKKNMSMEKKVNLKKSQKKVLRKNYPVLSHQEF